MNAAAQMHTVLVVDDEAGVRQFFSRALRLAGFAPIEASSGESALQLIADGLKPHAVLLDLSMPGIGGLELLSQLRHTFGNGPIPVAIVTGHLFISDRVRATADEWGVEIHHKPVTRDQLHELTNHLIHATA